MGLLWDDPPVTTTWRSGLELWLDDPEGDEGPAPETSHPAFVQVAPPEFYDKGDEFAPFGNDSGSDMLGNVQDWYLDGVADDELPRIVMGSLGDWDTEGITDGLWSGDSDFIDDWFAAWGDSMGAEAVRRVLIAAPVVGSPLQESEALPTGVGRKALDALGGAPVT